MKILLISPAVDPHKRTNKQLMIPPLALYILEGLTPPEHEVKIIEEEIEEINLNEVCDLVGISCMTANAPRAYEFATAFKKRGKKVILGGVHPTILPEEASRYADCVVIGEAEGVWETLIHDLQEGHLQKKYYNPNPDLGKYIPKKFSKRVNNRLFKLIPILTSRGCPYNCDFCCVTNLFGAKIRHIPIANVVRDIIDSKARNIIFLDDNIIGHKQYAKELFTALKPLKINWVGQASISFINDREMIKLAAESGCRALFIGIESVYEKQMRILPKMIKNIQNLERALKEIRKFHILIHASIIYGFDNDTLNVFDETVDFLIRNKVSTVSFNVLTPYPGTKTFQTLKMEGRLINDNWKYYDHNTVVFLPQNMTPYELQYGKTMSRRKFYSIKSIFKRLVGNMYSPGIYLAANYGHFKQVKLEAKRIIRLKKELFDKNPNEKFTPLKIVEASSL